MNGNKWLVFVSALLGALAVSIGAMGAHSLPNQLRAAGHTEDVVAKKIENCEIAVRYHTYHTLALFALGLSSLGKTSRAAKSAAVLMLIGITMFSGGLYCFVFLDNSFHWSIVPIGGTILIISWLVLAGAALTAKPTASTTV